MTIQQLFDELRKEPDWTKKVVVTIENDFKELKSVVPNIITDDAIILSTGNT